MAIDYEKSEVLLDQLATQLTSYEDLLALNLWRKFMNEKMEKLSSSYHRTAQREILKLAFKADAENAAAVAAEEAAQLQT